MTFLKHPKRMAALALALAALVALGPLARAEAAVVLTQLTTPTAGDRIAGTVNARYDIQFTTNVANGASQIIVTFPVGYTIGSTATVQDTVGNAGRITQNGVANTMIAGVTTNPATRQITVHLIGSPALNGGVNDFRILTGVTNPTTAGSSGLIHVTTNALGEVGATGSVTITGGATVVLQNSGAGASGNVTVTFTTASALPTNGRIAVTFPAGFAFNHGGTTLASSPDIAEALGTVIEGQTVRVHLLGGGAGKPAGSLIRLTLTNVRNPLSSGTTGSFTVRTETSAGAAIDTFTAAGVQIGVAPAPVVTPGLKAQHGHKVTVCHNGRTITIAKAAWFAAHHRLSTMGAC